MKNVIFALFVALGLGCVAYAEQPTIPAPVGLPQACAPVSVVPQACAPASTFTQAYTVDTQVVQYAVVPRVLVRGSVIANIQANRATRLTARAAALQQAAAINATRGFGSVYIVVP